MNSYRNETDTLDLCIYQLENILHTIPSFLRSFSDDEFSKKPSPDKWSKKEIIGHLIDSATNNHHRFIRAQFEDKPMILYDQDNWNKHGYYQDMDGDQLIQFWEIYNRQIVELIKRLPDNMLDRECLMSDGIIKSIGWLFEDYVRHLEHHLRQIGGEKISL